MSTSETQSEPMKVEPQKEHAWLQKLVGEWTYEGDCDGGPDKPRWRFSGTETVRSIGGIWIAGEGQGEMPGGGDATTVLALGFNPQTKRFVGTWFGSMMAHLWVYDGWLDEAERVLTLESDGPDMVVPGKTATYRDVHEIVDDDHRVLRAQAQGEDGSWYEFMVTRYERRR
jgi:hypothetical protein